MADNPIERPMDRFTRRTPPDSGVTTDGGFESGDAPVLMLDLVLAGGDRLGLPYSYISAIRLHHGERVELELAGRRVQIEGRNLGPLYTHLLMHHVWRIASATLPFDEGLASSWVKSIALTDDEAISPNG